MQAIPPTQQFPGHAQVPTYRTGAEPMWMRHDRTPGDPEDDFLVQPESAIGPIISAVTNKKKSGWHPLTSQQKAQRNALAVVLGLVLGMLGAFVGMWIHETLVRGLGLWTLREVDWAFALTFGLGGLIVGIVGPIAAIALLRRPEATFVGKHGIERYRRGLLFGPKLEVLRFDDASSLKVSRVRQFVNGVYSGTLYDYVWWDAKGKRAFRLNGSYRDDGKLIASEPVVFAFAAESAWSNHRIAYFDRMIAQQGMARFHCGRDWLGIGKGFLEIGAGGSQQRLAISDLENIHLEQGMLVLKKKGAREGFFSSEGVFRFPVAAMDDFQVFLVVLEEQTGVRFR